MGKIVPPDELNTAFDRAKIEMMETPCCALNGRSGFNLVELLVALGASRAEAKAVITKAANIYHMEMLASWTALYLPIPVARKKPDPVWKQSLYSTGRVMIYSLAALQVIPLLNEIVRALT